MFSEFWMMKIIMPLLLRKYKIIVEFSCMKSERSVKVEYSAKDWKNKLKVKSWVNQNSKCELLVPIMSNNSQSYAY